MKTTNEMLKNRIIYANEMLNTNIVNRNYNGFEHLTLDTENLFTGTKKECINFLNGLVQFQLLN